jgi:hypothetical protein
MRMAHLVTNYRFSPSPVVKAPSGSTNYCHNFVQLQNSKCSNVCNKSCSMTKRKSYATHASAAVQDRHKHLLLAVRKHLGIHPPNQKK